MILDCKNPWGQSYGSGVHISKVQIIGATDVSGQDIFSTGNPYDLAIKVSIDIGKEFFPDFIVAGNFKRDPETAEVTGWGSGFVVQEFLNKLGYSGRLNPENTLPVNAINSLLDKKFYRLSYVSGLRNNGTFKYSHWNLIATIDEGADSLFKRFEKNVLKGYPTNYRPDLTIPANTEFEFDDNGLE